MYIHTQELLKLPSPSIFSSSFSSCLLAYHGGTRPACSWFRFNSGEFLTPLLWGVLLSKRTGGEEPSVWESALWTEGTLQLWKDTYPRGRTTTFSVSHTHKERQIAQLCCHTYCSAPGPALLFIVTHTGRWHRAEFNGSRYRGDAFSVECTVSYTTEDSYCNVSWRS